jgi:hypothetical protein
MGLSYVGRGVGRCPRGGSHDHTGSYGYYLWYGGSPYVPDQDEWRWCDRCEGLFYGLGQPISKCPRSGPHRIGPGSFSYVLGYD